MQAAFRDSTKYLHSRYSSKPFPGLRGWKRKNNATWIFGPLVEMTVVNKIFCYDFRNQNEAMARVLMLGTLL